MLIWLLVLLLLIAFVYIVYRIVFLSQTEENEHTKEHHYTYKI